MTISDNHVRFRRLVDIWRRAIGAWTSALGDHIQRHGWADATGAAVYSPEPEATPVAEGPTLLRSRRAA